MATTPMALIHRNYRTTHQRILSLVAQLSDAELTWQPTPTTPSIGFHLWHLARWADHLQAAIPGMAPALSERFGTRHQIWVTDNLAAQWQLDGRSLGFDDTGMGHSAGKLKSSLR